MENSVTAGGFECMKKRHTLQQKDQVHETRSEVVPSGEGAWFWVPRAAVQNGCESCRGPSREHKHQKNCRTDEEPTRGRPLFDAVTLLHVGFTPLSGLNGPFRSRNESCWCWNVVWVWYGCGLACDNCTTCNWM